MTMLNYALMYSVSLKCVNCDSSWNGRNIVFTMKSCFKGPSCCETFLIIFISSGSFILSALFISIFNPLPANTKIISFSQINHKFGQTLCIIYYRRATVVTDVWQYAIWHVNTDVCDNVVQCCMSFQGKWDTGSYPHK